MVFGIVEEARASPFFFTLFSPSSSQFFDAKLLHKTLGIRQFGLPGGIWWAAYFGKKAEQGTPLVYSQLPSTTVISSFFFNDGRTFCLSGCLSRCLPGCLPGCLPSCFP